MLDIHTSRGQETVRQELRAAGILEKYFGGSLTYIHTPKTGSGAVCCVDALLVSRTNQLKALVETKCRDLTLDTLRGQYNNEWLITYAKVDRCVGLSRALCVPLCGLLYFVPEDKAILLPIYDPSRGWTCSMRRAVTTTRRTVNGGSADRENAFLNCSHATVLQ